LREDAVVRAGHGEAAADFGECARAAVGDDASGNPGCVEDKEAARFECDRGRRAEDSHADDKAYDNHREVEKPEGGFCFFTW
ncbi:MAG: hypothetical protein RLZ42_724, partial [Armatimonadota bacterium]